MELVVPADGSDGEDVIIEEEELGNDAPASSPALNAEVETLADGFEFTEGPIWIPATGANASLPNATLLFSDMRTNTIYSWSEADGIGVYSNNSMGTNGKALDLDGQLVGFRSGPRNVARGADPETAQVVASEYEGARFNSPNDGAVNPVDGAIFFSDPIWGILARPNETQELDFHGIYRIDADDASLSLELGGLAMPNGVAFSEEGDILFVSDTGGLPIHPTPELRSDEPPPTISAWALQDGRVLQPPVPLWSREDFSDGMCYNERGLWSTRSGMGPSEYGPKGLVLTDPATGQEIGHIPIDAPTNVECHTDQDGVLYVTSANKISKVTLL
uniref:SMP-30/Gluconolactonase/LRE-like region domain-containing protein n=1 Tax=Chloropicon laureae TaxID=464258 RepID=A0A7S2Z888_9CHLO